jgi:hypothetical protein
MKKFVFLCIFVFIAPLFIWAQGFYFDAGFNYGMSISDFDYDRVYDDGTFPFKWRGDGFRASLELKAGYGPFGNIPAYVVAHGEIGYTNFVSGDEIRGGIGTGVLFYPWRLLQLGASIGVNWMGNYLPYNSLGEAFDIGEKIDRDLEVDPHSGFAWNISAALDIGKKNHGILLGLNYFGAFNKFSYSYSVNESHLLGLIVEEPYTGKGNGTRLSTAFTLFVKYAYRKKPFNQTPAVATKGGAE